MSEKIPLVQLIDIHKRYGQGEAAFFALQGINFVINEGDFVAVMGPSGSGKSTCMNIVGALDTPTSGRYLFKPLLLLADEPTGSLDTKRSIEIMQLLKDLNEQDGITVSLVTHEPDMATFAKRIVHFRDGRIESDQGG